MIEVEDVEGVTVIRLAHGKVNALDIELCQTITETFKAIDSSGHRSVVLTGAGGAFSGAQRARRVTDGWIAGYMARTVRR